MRTTVAAFLLLGSGIPVGAQEAPPVDQQKIDEAIRKGSDFLARGGFAFGQFTHGKRNQPEALHDYGGLILLTLLHGGYYDEESPEIQTLVEHLLSRELTSTYSVSLHAMALQKLNPRKYQKRIAECAQFLVDNQAANGQWDYGEPDPNKPKPDPDDVATSGGGGEGDDVATGGGDPGASRSGRRTRKRKVGSTTALPRIPVVKKKPGPPNGDNSNSQYAALGLRACMDAGIVVQPRVLARAMHWWRKSQNADGGWGYNGNGRIGGGNENPTSVSNTSYGSMTVGAVGALCIYDYYMGKNYKRDGSVAKGLAWLDANYEIPDNPKKDAFAHYYYLYGLERVGMLYGTEKIGAHEWYPDGARYLLENQSTIGVWTPNDRLPKEAHVNTCFAILFLRRGTAPLKAVATGEADTRKRRAVANAGAPRGGVPRADAPLKGIAKAVEEIAPGFRVSGHHQRGEFPGLQAIRGRENVLSTRPASLLKPAVLRRTVTVPKEGKTTLAATVGHPERGAWTLIVRVNGRDVLTRPVAADTAREGWLVEKVDLTPHGGEGEILLELVHMPGRRGEQVAYWADVRIYTE